MKCSAILMMRKNSKDFKESQLLVLVNLKCAKFSVDTIKKLVIAV